MSQCDAFGLLPTEAAAEVMKVIDVVNDWKIHFAQVGVSQRDIESLAQQIASPYNPAIANAFFRAGEIEAWGRGVERIFAACEAAGSPKPVLRYTPYDMWTEFAFDEAYLKVLRAGQRQVERITPEVEAQDEAQDEALVELTATELTILTTCEANPSTGKDLLAATGYSQRTGNFKRAMERLLSLNLLAFTLPEKPNSRLQKYKLTAQGRRLINQK